MTDQFIKVSKENSKTRLDVFLSENLEDIPSRSFIKKLIDHGHVKVNEEVHKPHYKVCEGDEIIVEVPKNFLAPEYIEPEDIPLDIFYEDKYLLVVNKQVGMMVHPAHGKYTNTLVNALLNYSIQLSEINSQMRPGIVHRLDKETSGLIVIAKDNITHAKLSKQFKNRTIKKRYIALVEGQVEFDEGVINVPIGKHMKHYEKKAVSFDKKAREAITFYNVIKRQKDKTLLFLYPKTGRTHQLRVHMAHVRHPILGDDKYGKKSTFKRLALHAQSLNFTHPINDKYLELSTKFPEEFLG